MVSDSSRSSDRSEDTTITIQPPGAEDVELLASEEAIRAWIVSRIAADLKVPESEIAVDVPLVHLGLDSLVVFSMTGDLSRRLDRDLPASLLFELDSIDEAARALARLVSGDCVE